MFRLSTIHRRLLLSAGSLLVLSPIVVHTRPVRRFVLAQAEIELGNALGVVVDAKDLDYNLFTSWFELKDIALRDIRRPDMPAPLAVRQITARISVWRLLRGSFGTAQIQADGLSVRWITDRDGKSNWPSLRKQGGTGSAVGPQLVVTSGDLQVQDERNGLLLHLPINRLTGNWDPAAHQYRLVYESNAGRFQWSGSGLPIDQLHVRAALANDVVDIGSLRLLSGQSEMEVSGSLSGTPLRVETVAMLNLDSHELSLALGTAPAQGRLMALLSAAGPLPALQVKASLRAEHLLIADVPIRRPSAELLFDAASGEVNLLSLSASLPSGPLAGSGRFSTGGTRPQSQLTARFQAGSPLGPASLDVTASWPGPDWRIGKASGVVRSRSVSVAFAATGGPESVRTSLASTMPDGSRVHGEVGIRLKDRALSGVAGGEIDSLARFGEGLERLLDRPAGSLIRPAVDGNGRWSANLSGTIARPAASLDLQMSGLSIGAWTGADLQVSANYSREKVGVERARLAWRGQEMEIRGEIGGTSSEAPLNLEGTIAGRPEAAEFRNPELVPRVEAQVSGKLRISGTLAHPVAETALRAPAVTAYGQRFLRAELDARWQDGELMVSRLAADQDHGTDPPGHLEASGCLGVGTGYYAIEAAGRDLRPNSVRSPGDLPLTGTFQFAAHGEGFLSDPAFSAQIEGSKVTLGSLAIGGLHAGVDASDHRAVAGLSVPEMQIRGTSTIDMQGAWPFELALDSRGTRFKIDSYGTFDAAIRANGALMPLQLERAEAAIEKLRLVTHGQEISSDGPIQLSYADDRIGVRKLALKSGASALQVAGEMPLRDIGAPGALSLKGSLDLGSVARFLPNDLQPGGIAEVNGTIRGSIPNWQPAGSITIRDGRVNLQPVALPIEDINGRLKIEEGVFRLEQFTAKAGGGSLRMDGSAPLHLVSQAFPAPSGEETRPAQFSAQVDRVELSGGSGEQAVRATLGAKLEGEASALSLSALRGSVEFSQLEARAGKSRLQQTGTSRLTIAGGVAKVEGLEIAGADGSLRMNGTVGLTGDLPLQLETVGQIDIAFLSVLAKPLEAAGAVNLDVRVGGTLHAPEPSGSVELSGASFLLPNPRLQAANIKMRAELNGEHLTVKELTGNLNGGAFSGGGDLKVGTGGMRDVNLFLKGKDTFTEYPVAVKTTSSLDVKFASDNDRLVLSGEIEVQDGYYESSIDLFSRSDQSFDTGPEGGADEPSNPVALDLKIVTRRPVEMDNNLGRIAATADLRLGGTVNKVGLLGTLELEQDGKLYFGDRTYYIERGTVRFLDSTKVTPELNIQAYTRTGDYTIRLGLTGPLDELTTTFTSDPPMSRDDVIAILLTGKTVAENRGVDLRALEATSLATGAMNSALSSEVHRTLGISRVSIQPAAIAAESNPGARITITQDFTSSLRLLYSMNLSDSNDQIWIGEYDLSRRFTTRAVKQTDNTYRGEFRHDIRFGSSSTAAGIAPAVSTKRRISQVRFTGAAPFTDGAVAKVFKVKPGQQYKPIKVRKGSERLSKFLMKKGYLESRVRLDREDDGQDMALTVRIELGPIVELSYTGANMPKRQKAQVRKVWHAGISDQQRPQAAKQAILGYFAQKGFLKPQADVRIANDGSRKGVQFDVRPGQRFHGVKIVVEGAERERAKAILSLLHKRSMKAAVYRDPGRAADAITQYYRQRGYLAAKVAPPAPELDSDRRTGRILVSVVEGPVFHVGDLRFSGNTVIADEDLRTGMLLESGAIFEPARLDPTIASLRQKYGKLGYRDARIEYALARHDDLASVDVGFTIVENKQTAIGAIAVEGNRHTSEQFARSRLLVAEGDLANTELIRESVKSLSQTGAYTSADLHVGPPADVGAGGRPVQVADLLVAVTEPKPFRLLYGGLYDSGNGPGFIADFQNHNLLGAGRTLGLRTRVDPETDEARLYLTRPFWRQHRISTTIAVYFTRQTEYHQSTPTEKLGASIQQDVQLRSKWLLSYGYRYERQRGFIPDPAAPEISADVVSVSPLSLTFSRDARDSVLDATRGSFVSHGMEYAPRFLGSDYPYIRYYVQYFKYFPLIRPRPVPFGEKEQRARLVFATGTRLGLQKGFSEGGAVLTDRFYAGGGTTVRGFRQDELGPKLSNGQPAGGNAVLVINEELRYPLFWIFDGVSFVDVGNVYPRVKDFRFSELRTAGGFGLRIRNPFVVLRLDYGFKFGRLPGEKRGAFYFSIGQAF